MERVGSGWTGGELTRKAVGGVGDRTNCGWIIKGRKKIHVWDPTDVKELA